ncbi:MAG: flagellar biosynthetic protein FliR [Humidesulfovibrio sp.]|jgi:flagellar biosynthetic protein FliR|uniref:flagellar biosynthetic protein FliR n=1 Tax=Humidesulfovibrio sp. TaxID=2910988 RepID=UPI002735E168|nr:flagellar biosynthetic protein FliR [Humidesulfovibrio sp.]MDP2848095.1 flagellar biosynthetic protein FliR [Humidesulfovibrio sp.]
MDIFNFDPSMVLSFYLTLFRISVVLFIMPFFGDTLPNVMKASLLLVLSLAVWPNLSFPGTAFPAHPFNIAIMFAGEIVLGMTLGCIVRMLVAAVQIGGAIINFQMGFSMVNSIDPLTGQQEPMTTHFIYMCTMLTFLSLNGHLHLIKALGSSFDIVPPGGLFLSPELMNEVMLFSKQMFVLGVRIAAPVIMALFLVDLALALISRMAPQMNILVMGFPLKIAVGFLFLSYVMEIMSEYVTNFIVAMDGVLIHLMKLGAPHT